MKAYIRELELNTGEHVQLKEDDIVVFVGPNNVGKSQALSDIYEMCGRGNANSINGLVVRDIRIEARDTFNLEEQAIIDGWGYKDKGGNFHIHGSWGEDIGIDKQISEKGFGRLSSVLLFHSDAGSMQSAYDAMSDISDDGKNHPIHYLADNKELRDKASSGFRRAFGKDLLPHRLAGSTIPLCIGSEDDLNKSGNNKSGNEALDCYKAYYDSLPRIVDQSDGVRSFTSTLINLVLKHKQIYLLDEPETFLHPSQIQVLGQIICQYLQERQAFIATHSQDLIKGLLEADPNRVKIIRITRADNANSFQVLVNSEILNLWKDSLLKHSDILNGLFHKDVIVCESDSDCKMYSVILGDIKSEKDEFLQALFIPANGKHRIPKIVKPLRTMGVHVIGVFDIDLLSDKKDLKNAIEAFGGERDKLDRSIKILDSQLGQNVTHINREKFKKEVLAIIDAQDSKDLSVSEVKDIKHKLEITGKWGQIKKSGVSMIPAGDATVEFNTINDYLKKIGIHIVKEGELESFIKSVGNHGPEWVAEVFEKYPDLKSSEYEGIRNFVSSWGV